MKRLAGHWQLFVLSALVLALWQLPVALPFRLMVVFLHELSHALAALVTGGAVKAIALSADEGGVTTTQGGNLFAILSAGYLGSLGFGAVILLIALRTNADRALMAALGLVMLVIAALYLREAFALAFAIGAGLAMLAMARFLPRDINDLMLRLFGLLSLIYVPWDIFSDTIQRAGLRSDAYMLAQTYGGATVFWGGLWLVISALVIGACLLWGLGEASNIRLRRQR